MNGAPSPLGRHVPRTVLSEGQLRAMVARAYLDYEIAVIRLSDIRNDYDRRVVANVCEGLFLERGIHDGAQPRQTP